MCGVMLTCYWSLSLSRPVLCPLGKVFGNWRPVCDCLLRECGLRDWIRLEAKDACDMGPA